VKAGLKGKTRQAFPTQTIVLGSPYKDSFLGMNFIYLINFKISTRG
jgi:hypothetical protein